MRALLLFALLLVPTEASAFCRTTTNQSNFTPSASKPCEDTGRPLYWASKCVGFGLQRDASVKISYEDALAITAVAFAQWTGADCTSGCAAGPTGNPSLAIKDLGPATCDKV